MPDIISASNVSKHYRKGLRRHIFNALEDVSFSAAAGESIGFIGHNGAGKSTMIRIIMGLQTPTSGSVLLQGMDPRVPESRRGVAYVPENPLLYDHLSPNELIRLTTLSHGISPNETAARTRKWLERLNLAEVADKRVRQFSKGMVQRTTLAMALAVEPRFLILDEPLSGLDPTGRREVVEILSEYRRNGGGMLFSSHVLTDVEVLADRFLFIHKGRIRVTGTPGTLLQGHEDSYEVIIEATDEPPPGFSQLYGLQYKLELDANALEMKLSELRNKNGVRLINIRSRNTLESAYFRFVAEAERSDARPS
ncbi:MAG TPA: ABC transporter ATP-binding protein [Rhodocyclaceae bacterium]|nr:ABC transporter ATP-binding protein [Rhodocyclaceae bacterium]